MIKIPRRFVERLLIVVPLLFVGCSGASPDSTNLSSQAPPSAPTPNPIPSGPVQGLDFPGSSGVTIRFKFTGPDLIPIYGPSNAGVTYIWRAYPREQPSYYTTFFWGNDDGAGNINTFLWCTLPGCFVQADSMYGAHPYPTLSQSGTTIHQWEIAVEQNDVVNGTVVFDRWYTQALRVWADDTGQKHHEFYWDLPNTDPSHMVERVTPAGYGNMMPPSPALTWGDAPWNPGNEVWDGIMRGIQIYASALSLADIQRESAQPLSTTAGASTVWYVNLNPTPTDITDKSGKNHNPDWVGSERPALYSAP